MKGKILKLSIICVSIIVILGVFVSKKNEVKDSPEEDRLITIGFSQVGAESDWRTANSISIKRTFTQERGYDLIFEDARQKQENQIMAIRSFIQQDVDYIVFSPVVETGWDTVLEEAKLAEIPVIIIDRMVEVRDESLYTAWVGSDFYLQGQKACSTLNQYVKQKGISEVNIVNIQGTLGATSQVGRTKAFEDAAKKYGWNILAQEPGEYTEAKAYEVMSSMLKEYDNINFVYCENDNEAFGAIEAIENAGKTVGVNGDIQLISFDATEEGLRNTLEGKIIINVECNPLQGAAVEKIIEQLEEGKTPDKQKYIPEEIFAFGNEYTEVMLGGRAYKVTPVTEEVIAEREY